jgi:hypothetical protein
MKLTPNKLWSALIATAAVCATMPVLAAMKPQGQAEYDYATSRAKLERIGQALQLYRQEHGVKAVELRQNFSDAGLPFHLRQLAHPNRTHPIPLDNFFLPWDQAEGMASSFIQLYRPTGEPGAQQYAHLFAARGEKLPILADLHMNGEAELTGKAPGKALILRLDGTVDLVTTDTYGTHQLRDK